MNVCYLCKSATLSFKWLGGGGGARHPQVYYIMQYSGNSILFGNTVSVSLKL